MGGASSRTAAGTSAQGALAAGTAGVDEDLLNTIRALKQQETVDFFNRKDEMANLIELLAREPSRITLLLGPVDSGKSKLLLHLKQLWEQHSELRQLLAPYLLVNMRERDCSNPEGLAEVLAQEVRNWQDVAESLMKRMGNVSIPGGVTLPLAPIGEAIAAFSKGFHQSTGLGQIQDTIQLYLKRHPHVRPVIIIDEANMLKSWKEWPEQLSGLFRFFIWLTKEANRGHVILASSDDFFRSWIANHVESSRLKLFPLGHFSKDDAKQFLIKYVMPRYEGSLPAFDVTADNDWDEIYHVTGGSPQLIKTLVQDAVEFESWKDAVENMLSSKLEGLRNMDLESVGFGCTQTEFEGLMKALVNGGGIVAARQVFSSIFFGQERGKQILKKLIERNIIHVRVWRKGMKYKDLPVGRGDDTEYLMAVTPAGFAAMKAFFS